VELDKTVRSLTTEYWQVEVAKKGA